MTKNFSSPKFVSANDRSDYGALCPNEQNGEPRAKFKMDEPAPDCGGILVSGEFFFSKRLVAWSILGA